MADSMGECVTEELRALVDAMERLEAVTAGVAQLLRKAADRIDVRAEDEVSYALAQAGNDLDDALEYAHDTGFDEGWQAACDELRTSDGTRA